MDLTSLYRMVSSEAPSVPEQMMRGAANQAALQQADESLMANKRLRELYASGNQPSMQELMSIDPRLGIEMQQAQFKNMLEAGQIEKLNREKQDHDSRVYARHMAPIAQDYFDDLKKMSPEQAEYKFRNAVGNAQAQIEQKFGIVPQVDFTQFSPLQIAQRAHSIGEVDIPYLKELEEQQKSQLSMQQKQAPGASDRYFIGPDGLPHLNPLFQSGGQQAPVQSQIQPYPVFEFDGKQYSGPDFMRMAIHEKDPAKKQRMESIMDAGFQQQQEGTLTSPDVVEKPKTRQELAIEEETGKERAKLKVQDEQDAENKLATIASMPSDDELMKYLNDATVGKGEEILKGPVASFFHIENKAQAADTVLGALQENIKNIATKAKGDMNIAEVRAYDAAVGALNNKDLGPQARFKAYVVAKNMVLKKIAAKHPEISQKYGISPSKETEQSIIAEPKTVAEAKALPKGTIFKVPGTNELRINP